MRPPIKNCWLSCWLLSDPCHPGLARLAPGATLHGCSPLTSVDPASVIALVGLGGSGVMALWKIANGLGRFESRTTTILEGVQVMLKDHEERIRTVESKL